MNIKAITIGTILFFLGVLAGVLLAPKAEERSFASRIEVIREDTSAKQTKFTTRAYSKINVEARALVEQAIPSLRDTRFDVIVYPISIDGFSASLYYDSMSQPKDEEADNLRELIWNRMMELSK